MTTLLIYCRFILGLASGGDGLYPWTDPHVIAFIVIGAVLLIALFCKFKPFSPVRGEIELIVNRLGKLRKSEGTTYSNASLSKPWIRRQHHLTCSRSQHILFASNHLPCLD